MLKSGSLDIFFPPNVALLRMFTPFLHTVLGLWVSGFRTSSPSVSGVPFCAILRSVCSRIVPAAFADAPLRSWKVTDCVPLGGRPLNVLTTFARPATLQLALAGLVWTTLLRPYFDASVAVPWTVLLTDEAPDATGTVTP